MSSKAKSLARTIKLRINRELRTRLRNTYFGDTLRLQYRAQNPVTMNDHIRHHMAFSRDPLLTTWSDKYRMQAWVSERYPEVNFPKIYQVAKSFDELDLSSLPKNFALKTNHGSGSVILVTEEADPTVPFTAKYVGKKAVFKTIKVHPSQFDAAKAAKVVKSWMAQNYSHRPGIYPEWGYRNIRPLVFVEEYLSLEGNTAPDIKLFMANGKFVAASMHGGRHEEHYAWDLDENWQLSPVRITTYISRTDSLPPKPQHWDDMVRIAYDIAKYTKLVRVDYYEVEGKLYLGELTNYPMAGRIGFTPEDDLALAQKIFG